MGFWTQKRILVKADKVRNSIQNEPIDCDNRANGMRDLGNIRDKLGQTKTVSDAHKLGEFSSSRATP